MKESMAPSFTLTYISYTTCVHNAIITVLLPPHAVLLYGMNDPNQTVSLLVLHRTACLGWLIAHKS